MNIKTDSRKVLKGDIFVALKNYNDGHKYIKDAINKGASKIVIEYGNYDIPTIKVKDTKKYLINYLKKNYYNQIKNIKLIGITGTNGKTTTAFLLYQALNLVNIKCAFIGTIGFYIEDKIKALENTTPDILELYELILEAKKHNCQYIVMEVSSHALDQRRIEGLKFDIAIFTNLTEEHLDYHKNMDNYALTKQKLFNKVKEKGYTIVNIDDKYKEYFLKNNSITYGFNKSDNQIVSYKLNNLKTEFIINNEKYITNLIGKYNIYNLTVVIIILKILKIKNIKEIIYQLKLPIGRMEKINYKNNLIIIDYAHTPDAVKKILLAIKEIKINKIYTIIGCGGQYDKYKRPLIGKIVTDLADYVIFTSDNPRYENPYQIVADIIQKLDRNNYEIIINRKKAIEKGIQKLLKNDILLILGKGHENFQVIKDKKILFNDKEIVINIIRR